MFETTLVLLLPHSGAETLSAVLAFRIVYYLLPVAVALTALAGYEVYRRSEVTAPRVKQIGGWISSLVPPVFALGAFLAGVVLLVSGATPGTGSRMASLNEWVPLAVIEASHFAASLVGTGLLFLALGLRRRLAEAYRLTLALLAAGIVASLLKGLDWEEALILGAPAGGAPSLPPGVLPPGFPDPRAVHGRLDRGRGGGPAARAWLGLFAYRHVEFSQRPVVALRARADAPRFLRATVGAAGSPWPSAAVRLLRPAPPSPRGRRRTTSTGAEALAGVAADRRLTWRSSATSRSSSRRRRDAFLMYAVQGRTWVRDGRPGRAGEERAPSCSWRLPRPLPTATAAGRSSTRWRENDLHLYVDLGLSLLKLGEEARVPLAGFSLEGSKQEVAAARAEAGSSEVGCRFGIVPAAGGGGAAAELAAVSDAWLAEKSARREGLLAGLLRSRYLARFPVARGRGGRSGSSPSRTSGRSAGERSCRST